MVERPRADSLVIALVVVLGTILFTVAAAAHGFQGPDEPRYASIAREMAESGDPIVLTLGGRLYSEKPPLWFWAAALSGKVLGRFDDFSARLPSVLAGALLLLVIARLGGRLMGNLRTGALAAAMFALSVQGLTMAHRAYLDTTLALFTVTASLLFLIRLSEGRCGVRAHAFAWFLIGLGLLTKGPPAFIPPLLAVAVWAVARRDPRAFIRIAPLRGIGIALGVAAIWLVPWALRVGGDELAKIWTEQVAGRISGEKAHAQPFWFYLSSFPAQFLPWTAFVPILILAGFRDRNRRSGSARLPLLWFAAGFLLFSLIVSKRPLYLLPLYPAACLIVADHLRRASSAGRIGVASGLVTALILLACGGIALFLAPPGTARTLAIAIAVCAAGTAALVARLSLRDRAGAGAMVALMALLVLMIPSAILIGPVADEVRGAGALVEAAERHLRSDDVPVRYRTRDRSLSWYTNRRWRWAGDHERVKRHQRRGPLLLAGEEERLRGIPGIDLIERVDYDGEVWALGRLGAWPLPGVADLASVSRLQEDERVVPLAAR
jgi:4-amino-4-deoxy-L-arabinose transferase-like glycosyltransferase